MLPFLESKRQDYFVVYADGFNYLTKMCLTNMREATFRMMRIARDWGCTVIVSSSDSTDHVETYLDEGADFVINGEAEHTLMELLEALEAGQRDLSGIKGLAYAGAQNAGAQNAGAAQNAAGTAAPTKPAGATWVVRTPPRPVMKDWEVLPSPAYDLVDMEQYRRHWIKNAGYFSLNVATTRGCPFHCNWCAKPIYGNRYTARSAEHVVQQLVRMKEAYDFDHIWFCDDIFGLKPGWMKAFADAVEREGLVFRFKIQSRADLLLSEDQIRDLARAGCENVWMGAESGSQKILDAMDKGTTIAQIEQATRLLKVYGIKPSFFIQFGYLGETREDIDLTIGMIRRLLPHEIGISVSYPLPGTGFYDKVKASLGDKANWSDSDDLAMMFAGAYPAAFYKQLYRYVHRIHRGQLARYYIMELWRKPYRLSVAQARKMASILYYLPAARLAKLKLQHLDH
jgi:radical SAM superfamily enzyme YgiQ (UPF0313 family)